MAYYSAVKEIEGNYQVSDSTDGGYVNRAETHSYQSWVSKWTSDFQFVSLTMNGDDMSESLENKHDYYHHKSIRAKARHLKQLKEHLGLLAPKAKQKDTILYLEKDSFSVLSTIRKEEVELKPQTIVFPYTTYKRQQIHFVEVTTETIALAKEYNEKLAEFKKYREDMLKKIFSEGEKHE